MLSNLEEENLRGKSEITIDRLPSDIIHLIFTKLPLSTITRCTRVSRKWLGFLSADKLLWKVIDLSNILAPVTDASLDKLVFFAKNCLSQLLLPNATKLTHHSLKILLKNQHCFISKFTFTGNLKVPAKAFTSFFSASQFRNTVVDLDLSNTKLDDEGVRKIFFLFKKILILNVSNCHITDTALFIKSRTPLEQLSLVGCDSISNKGIVSLLKFTPKLTSLNLLGCKGVNSAILTKFDPVPKLTSINISGIHIIENSLMDSLALFSASCPNMKKFILRFCPFLDDSMTSHIFACWDNLEHLDLKGSVRITNQSILDLGALCPELKVLNIASCPRISSNSILSLIKICPLLQALDISSIPNVSDETLSQISLHAMNLTTLLATDCNNVSGLGIAKLLRKKGHPMELINMSRCSGIGNETIREVRALTYGTGLRFIYNNN